MKPSSANSQSPACLQSSTGTKRIRAIDEAQAIYLALPIAACIIDRSLSFIALSQRYAELMRLPLESILGRSMDGLNPAEHVQNVRRDFHAFDNGQTVADHEIELWDGNYLVSVAPLVFANDLQTSAISVTLVNITNHKRLQQHLSGRLDQLTVAKEEVDRLAKTDALTGLGNRHAFDVALHRILSGEEVRFTMLALLILDVDFFKRYNDTYGHLAGDECLQRIARVIETSLQRPHDQAARFGGEEFVVILPDTDVEGAYEVGERIRRAIEEMRIEHTGNRHKVVTASIGVSHQRINRSIATHELVRTLLSQADTALYAAKLKGRNLVALQSA